MHHYRAVITYRGTRYQGWQIQPQGATIQGELRRAMSAVAKSEEVRSIGSGRTDAGVHALGQVARLDMPLEIPPESLLKALNSHLPSDIRVVACEASHENFHPTYQAESKWYSYFFHLATHPDALTGELMANYGFAFDLSRAQKAAARFVGTHDFQNFQTEGTEVSTTVRTIHSCEVLTHPAGSGPFSAPGPFYEVRIHGNGFLKQMVRLMVGAIWNVSRGKIDADAIDAALQGQRVERLSAVAPPEGLYLMRVVYPLN